MARKTAKQADPVKVTKAEFARMANVSGAAITKAIKSGSLVVDKNGMIDPNHDSAKFYLETQQGKPLAAEIATGEIDAKRQNIILKNLKLKQELEYRAGNLLDREKVRTVVFMYLDKTYSNLERLSGVFLDDICHKILTDGLTPEVRSMWKSAVLSEIDNAKNEVVRRVREIAEAQKN